jgi:hypothetical protein
MGPEQRRNTMLLDQTNGFAHTSIRETLSVAPRREMTAYHSSTPNTP